MIINIITDYNNDFLCTKEHIYYRNNLGINSIRDYFREFGYQVKIFSFSDIQELDMFKGQYVIYTSLEDEGLYYKGYIEDVIFGLELSGAKVIPSFEFLRAHSNKVFMEILRKIYIHSVPNIKTYHIGVFEDIIKFKPELMNWNKYIIKKSIGSGSSGVELATDYPQMLKKAWLLSYSKCIGDFKNYIMSKLSKGRIGQKSWNRNKIIIQEFIPELEFDWKILVFWNKVFVLKRNIKNGDFRASGSGIFSFEEHIEESLLNYALNIRKQLDVPIVSLDICLRESKYYLLEFQAIRFGLKTIVEAPFYYVYEGGAWLHKEDVPNVGKIYTESIHNYITSMNPSDC